MIPMHIIRNFQYLQSDKVESEICLFFFSLFTKKKKTKNKTSSHFLLIHMVRIFFKKIIMHIKNQKLIIEASK